MPTRAQVLVMIENGVPYAEAARRLGIDAGLAYMIATGLPADGGDTVTAADRERPGFVEGSTQHLANDSEVANPTRKEHVLEWVRQRALGDAQMQQAAAARDPDPGQTEDPGRTHDLPTVLTRDHNRVTALLKQLSALAGHKKGGSAQNIRRRGSIVDMVSSELGKHEAVEEQYLWPTVVEALPDGDELSRQGRRQEQETSETLASLARSDPDSDEFDELVEQLVLQARKHVAHEDRVFLMLRDVVPRERLDQLGRQAQEAKQAAAPGPQRRGREEG